MKLFFFLLLLSTCQLFAQNIKPGYWNAQLQLTDNDVLPFRMKIDKNNQISIINAEEIIVLDSGLFFYDSLRFRFPYFNSELVFKLTRNKMNGYWVNYQKSPDYKIPFVAIKTRKKTARFKHVKNKKNTLHVDYKWEVKFEPGKDGEYSAVGLFNQKNNKISGTFLTETGDYRFLEGNTTKDSLYLSCFDGSHAFLFKALYKEDSLIGTFNSGSHWKSEWEAIPNEKFELKDPEKITYIVDEQPILLSLPNLQKDTVQFPNKNFENKVVILQIMGTWCPNCLDETFYFKELYEKYHTQGLEIISVCYEVGNNLDEYIENVNRLKNKMDLQYYFLIGGNAKKGLATQHFYMLNKISSFPTTIIIGKDGEVKQIHTGFNGPSTGEYYLNYKKKMNALIQSLLNI